MAALLAVVLGIGLVHRDNIEVAVAIQIRHDKTVAATNVHAANDWIVDDVLAPRDVEAVAGAGFGWRGGDGW